MSLTIQREFSEIRTPESRVFNHPRHHDVVFLNEAEVSGIETRDVVRGRADEGGPSEGQLGEMGAAR